MDNITSIISSYKNKNYQYYRHVLGQKNIDKYFLHYLKKLGDKLNIQKDNKGISAYSVSTLPWDSDRIGVSSGRIDFLFGSSIKTQERAIQDVIEKAKAFKISHLSIRVSANEIATIHLLEGNGFVVVDGILTFSLDISNRKFDSNRTGFRLATVSDIPQIRKIASTIYIFDRFHKDPFITKEKADLIHADWMENSVKGVAADSVIVSEDQEYISGFVTCKVDRDSKNILGKTIGTIILVGVTEAYQGKGIASDLTFEAINWFYQNNVDIVEVGTQIANIPASRVYIKSGFNIVNTSFSLRLLL